MLHTSARILPDLASNLRSFLLVVVTSSCWTLLGAYFTLTALSITVLVLSAGLRLVMSIRSIYNKATQLTAGGSKIILPLLELQNGLRLYYSRNLSGMKAISGHGKYSGTTLCDHLRIRRRQLSSCTKTEFSMLMSLTIKTSCEQSCRWFS